MYVCVCMFAVGSSVSEKGEELDRPTPAAKKIPRLKIEASLSNIRVAIVEDVGDPQALTLRVSLFFSISSLPPSPLISFLSPLAVTLCESRSESLNKALHFL